MLRIPWRFYIEKVAANPTGGVSWWDSEPPSSSRNMCFIVLFFIPVIKNDFVPQNCHHHVPAFHVEITHKNPKPISERTSLRVFTTTVVPFATSKAMAGSSTEWRAVLYQAGVKFINLGQCFPRRRGIGTQRTVHCQATLASSFEVILIGGGILGEMP